MVLFFNWGLFRIGRVNLKGKRRVERWGEIRISGLLVYVNGICEWVE